MTWKRTLEKEGEKAWKGWCIHRKPRNRGEVEERGKTHMARPRGPQKRGERMRATVGDGAALQVRSHRSMITAQRVRNGAYGSSEDDHLTSRAMTLRHNPSRAKQGIKNTGKNVRTRGEEGAGKGNEGGG